MQAKNVLQNDSYQRCSKVDEEVGPALNTILVRDFQISSGTKILQRSSGSLAHPGGELWLRVRVKSAVLPFFDTTSHWAMRIDEVWETGPSNNPVDSKTNDAWATNLKNYKPGGKKGNQPFALILKQTKEASGFCDAFRGEQRPLSR